MRHSISSTFRLIQFDHDGVLIIEAYFEAQASVYSKPPRTIHTRPHAAAISTCQNADNGLKFSIITAQSGNDLSTPCKLLNLRARFCLLRRPAASKMASPTYRGFHGMRTSMRRLMSSDLCSLRTIPSSYLEHSAHRAVTDWTINPYVS